MLCRVCGKSLPDAIRLRCGYCNTKIRRYRQKAALIELLGGKCSKCGWTGPAAALEFHHHNGDKLHNVGAIYNQRWELVKAEAVKCKLLCSNCHRIEHSKYDEVFMQEVNAYRGRTLS